jgi:hypothetical protein
VSPSIVNVIAPAACKIGSSVLLRGFPALARNKDTSNEANTTFSLFGVLLVSALRSVFLQVLVACYETN